LTHDVINEKQFINTKNIHKLNLAYKPFIEMIINISSNINDIVLDPIALKFNAIIAANNLKRKWIGIGSSKDDFERLETHFDKNDIRDKTYELITYKYNYNDLRQSEAFNFERWIVGKFGGIPNIKQRHDQGIDGKTIDNIPIQVKRQDNISRDQIDRFNSAIRRFNRILFKNDNKNKIVGYFIAFSYGSGAKKEVIRLNKEEGIIIKLVTVDEIVPIKN
jgi:site-specific DNA-methyltransferase (adenine-specific)